MIRGFLFSLVSAALVAAVVASSGEDRIPKPGDAVEAFAAKDLDGKAVEPFAPGAKAVVLAFSGIHCPVAAVQAPRLAELAGQYQEKGVRFLLVNPNPNETAAEIAEAAKGAGIAFPILPDPAQEIASRLGVERTTEIVVFDPQRKIVYRGGLDDQYGVGNRKPAPQRRYLVEALDAVLDGRAVVLPRTKPQGCLIGKVKEAPAAAAAIPTYHKDVAPILRKHCLDCHRAGEIGPFPLGSFDDAEGVSRMIGEVVEQGRMPPWHADPKYGKWANDRRLSDPEKQTILRWVRGGAPEGEKPKNPPPIAASAPAGVWHIGTPDLVVRTPLQKVPATGTIQYRYITVPTNLSEDKWVAKAEIHPGARGVVHHILVFCEYPKERKGEEPPIDGGLEAGYFASLVPGERPNEWPADAGKLVPAGAKLLFQIHYTANGTPQEDVTEIGLVFHKTKPKKTVVTRGITQRRLKIEPNDPAATFQSTWSVPADVKVLSFLPHMHFRGKSYLYEVTRPAGAKETLLSVPRYDFNWQATYFPAKPVKLEKGSKVVCTAVFDNSSANPANPNPNVTVKWGEQSWDEMMIGYVDYVEE